MHLRGDEVSKRLLDVTIEGDAKLMRRLGGIKEAVKRRILKKAVNDAARPWVKIAKSKAPRQSGLLRKSMGIKVRVYRSTGNVVAMVGPRKGFKREVVVRDRRGRKQTVMRDPIRYAHLVEKQVRYLWSTYESDRKAAQDRLNSRIASEIEKEARKGG